ncbi:MAG: 4-hydroxy-tetrahydrodipicolinate reductase [Rhodospirillaceae bacterium]|nr:MAG: 4-hydroxy-tetrahydrodipicolinate reductase [Rhodospirillaceae bacterium]
MTETRIGILGAGGRMGCMLIREIAEQNLCLAAAAEKAGHAACGEDAGCVAGLAPLGVTVTDNPAALFSASDVVIDFTWPTATVCHASLAVETKTALVIGTTGMDPDQEKAIATAAGHAAIVKAPNMSLAVNLLFALARHAASVLDAAYDVSVSEIHHRHKLDSPSGTALALRDAAVAGGRKTDEIAMTAIRAGDIVGEHGILFAGAGERLEITHKATSREVFARGAVHAARWVAGQPPGLYGMADVLGLD